MKSPRLFVAVCMLSVVPWLPAAETIDLSARPLSEWEFLDGDKPLKAADAWRIENGVLYCTGEPRGFLATREEFENFSLELEWRWSPGTEGGNSGVLVFAVPGQAGLNQWPLCLEAQLMKNNAGDFWVIGNGMAFSSDRRSFKPKGVAVFRVSKEPGVEEKPVGEWNAMKVVSRDGGVTIEVNGAFANRIAGVDPRRGRIGLQSEGAPIEFRNVRVTPMPSTLEKE